MAGDTFDYRPAAYGQKQEELATALMTIMTHAVLNRSDVIVREENGDLVVLYQSQTEAQGADHDQLVQVGHGLLDAHIVGESVASNSSIVNDLESPAGSPLGQNDDDIGSDISSVELNIDEDQMDYSAACADDQLPPAVQVNLSANSEVMPLASVTTQALIGLQDIDISTALPPGPPVHKASHDNLLGAGKGNGGQIEVNETAGGRDHDVAQQQINFAAVPEEVTDDELPESNVHSTPKTNSSVQARLNTQVASRKPEQDARTQQLEADDLIPEPTPMSVRPIQRHGGGSFSPVTTQNNSNPIESDPGVQDEVTLLPSEPMSASKVNDSPSNGTLPKVPSIRISKQHDVYSSVLVKKENGQEDGTSVGPTIPFYTSQTSEDIEVIDISSDSSSEPETTACQKDESSTSHANQEVSPGLVLPFGANAPGSTVTIATAPVPGASEQSMDVPELIDAYEEMPLAPSTSRATAVKKTNATVGHELGDSSSDLEHVSTVAQSTSTAAQDLMSDDLTSDDDKSASNVLNKKKLLSKRPSDSSGDELTETNKKVKPNESDLSDITDDSFSSSDEGSLGTELEDESDHDYEMFREATSDLPLGSHSTTLDANMDIDNNSNALITKPQTITNSQIVEGHGQPSHSQRVVRHPSPSKGPPKKMRSRKLMTDAEMMVETRKAMDDEKERCNRVADKRVLFEKLSQEVEAAGSSSNGTGQRLILEIDVRTKRVTVEVEPKLVSYLKPHQVEGIKFLYNAVIESVEQVTENNSVGSGCILAHSMGLGKTIQTIAFLYTICTNRLLKDHFKRVLIVAPKNCTMNWMAEFKLWLAKNGLTKVAFYNFDDAKKAERGSMIRKWRRENGVLIIGHNVFSSVIKEMANKNATSYNRQYEKTIRKCLLNPDIVVVDEGHYIKNPRSGLNLALSQVTTMRRVILTGTPLQNNLEEYHTMASFVKPNYLGSIKEFRNQFSNPIKNGSSKDSALADVQLMKEQSSVLYHLLEGFVQRLTWQVLSSVLEPKNEYVIQVKLTRMQIDVYRKYLDEFYRGGKGGTKVLSDANIFRSICAHPSLMYKVAEKARLPGNKEDAVESSESTECEDEDVPGDKTLKEKATYCERMVALGNESWFNKIVPKGTELVIEWSAKFELLLDIIKLCEARGDKLVVFSQQLEVLDMIETILKDIEYKGHNSGTPRKDGDPRGTWRVKRDYFRIDGKVNSEERMASIDTFNDSSNTRARLFLLSTKAGSVGINLIGANRCVIFDASWNPTHDIQAIFRIYRFGQTKECFIYRFVSKGTMEEKVYERQIGKESLAARVVDKHNIERHFNKNENLYQFEPTMYPEPVPDMPNDQLLLKLLEEDELRKEAIPKKATLILNYHNHDSLLVNQDSGLSEGERMAAWARHWDEWERKRQAAPGPEIQYWKEHCDRMLDNLIDDENSEPFRHPIDEDEYPDYDAFIVMPMDLNTVKENLRKDEYKSPERLRDDVELIFTNADLYEGYPRQVKTMLRKLTPVFNREMKLILSDHKIALSGGKGKPKATPRKRASQPKTSTPKV